MLLIAMSMKYMSVNRSSVAIASRAEYNKTMLPMAMVAMIKNKASKRMLPCIFRCRAWTVIAPSKDISGRTIVNTVDKEGGTPKSSMRMVGSQVTIPSRIKAHVAAAMQARTNGAIKWRVNRDAVVAVGEALDADGTPICVSAPHCSKRFRSSLPRTNHHAKETKKRTAKVQ